MPEVQVCIHLAIWRSTWMDSLELACHVREFIDAGLRRVQVVSTGA
jgi:hypothetical protein